MTPISYGHCKLQTSQTRPATVVITLEIVRVRYLDHIIIQDGDSFLLKLENLVASAKQVLYQLASLRVRTATLHGSKQYTRAHNTVLVMVSVASHGQSRT